jgi:hypothetical protein
VEIPRARLEEVPARDLTPETRIVMPSKPQHTKLEPQTASPCTVLPATCTDCTQCLRFLKLFPAFLRPVGRGGGVSMSHPPKAHKCTPPSPAS